MRVGNVSSPRLAPTDRNPTNISKAYAASVAPHGATVRFTYTVPTKRQALVNSTLSTQTRISVAGAIGESTDEVQYNNVGGATASNISYTDMELNLVGSYAQMNTGQAGLVVAGDQILGITADGSTAGTIAHQLDASMTEYDA